MNYGLLKELCDASGVSGYEGEVLSYIAGRIKDKVFSLGIVITIPLFLINESFNWS